MTVAPAELLAGRYRLGQILGSGATATVRMAHDVVLDRSVAVKLFDRAAADEDLRDQESEAIIAAVLQHPALTSLLDAGLTIEAGVPRAYLVLDYVEGADLRELLLNGGAMTAVEVCWLGMDLAGALEHMHTAGFLHRDVKPANILVEAASSGRRRRARLTDFGISSPVGRGEASDQVTGTAAYISPEQAQGDDAGTASDVYALGLVLLEALTGVRAFPGPAAESTFDRIVRDPVVPDWLPGGIAAIVRSMTVRSPAQRCTLRRVVEQLSLLVADAPSAAVVR